MGKDAKFEGVLDALLGPLDDLLEDIREAENQREANEKIRQEAYMGKIPYPIVDGKADYGSLNQTLKFYGDGRTYFEDKKPNLSSNKFPFELIDLPLTETNYAYICENEICRPKDKAEEGFSPITKCPKYLGFRIDGEETRLYLYIGTLNDEGEFEFDDTYHIDTTDTGAVNHLRQSHNRFIETDGEKYFYYKINKGSKEHVTLVGCDEFPEGESDVVATTTTVVKNYGDLMATTAKYYSVILPSGCFYAVLNKKGMPTFLKPDTEDEETTSVPIFNVSYQTGVELVDGNEKPTIEINRGASFGVIPEGVGAALLRLPHTYELSDLRIYTDKLVKSNAKSGRRGKAKEIGGKLIKDFYFKSQKEIFWNDSVRPMREDRTFYGVPYSSRWVNSHYLGFEVSAETVLNALNDPYSVAYDGGFVSADFDIDKKTGKEVPVKMYRDVSVSGHTEISGNEDEPEKYGGTGYGLVCSAFTNLICGNPYPQSNRGYTFDSNYILEDTVDMNSGEVLVNKGLSHCVFVDEIYNEGYSLYEAVDPCVAKTTHTCRADKTTYASSRVKTSTLDKYVYSIVNKDTSGYDRLSSLINLDNITIKPGKVRPWRGNKAVYGSWDKTPKAEGRSFGGSGIGVTLHDGTTKFVLRYPSYATKIIDKSDIECFAYFADNGKYADISSLITENGKYELYALNESGEKASESEFFRFYNHDTVKLTFDAEGKAVFKYSDGEHKGEVADDVEYIYVEVRGFGGAFGKDTSRDQTETGAMVIAKGKCYPDLALNTSRILDVRAAIVSDPAEDCWGKYSCATSPDVVSEYKGEIDIETEFTIEKKYKEEEVYNANAVNQGFEMVVEEIENVKDDVAKIDEPLKKLSDSIGEVINYETIIFDADGKDGIYAHSVLDGIYKVADGSFNSGVANARSTEKIPVKANEQYTVEGTCTGIYALFSEFDENQNWIASYGASQLKKYTFSSVSPNTPYVYTVPEGVSYVAFSTHNTTSVPLKLIGPVASLRSFDDMISDEVNPIKEDATQIKQNLSDNESKASNAIGTTTYLKDITNKLTLEAGAISGSNGKINANSNAQATQPFKVSVGEIYHIWGRYSTTSCIVAWYDDAQEFINSVCVTDTTNGVVISAENQVFTVPELLLDRNGNEKKVGYMACSTLQTSVTPLFVKKEITAYNNVKDMVLSATEDLAATKLNKTLISPNGSEWVLTISNDGTLTPIKIRAVGGIVDTTITLPNGLAVGTYTLKYEGAEGVSKEYADICSLDVTAVGSTVSYNGLIAENCALEGVTSIGVYNSSDEKVGGIDLGFLNTQYSGKLYSFAALSDVHIGDKDHFPAKFENTMDIIDDTDNDISFTVICGDMVDDASNEKQLDVYQSIVKGLNKPVYVTMGNHETINILNAGKTFDDIKLYFKQDNYDINQKLYFSFSPEGSDDVFIMFGISGLYSKYQALSVEQLQWLYETLEENRNKRCFLFHHYFPYDGSGDAIDCYDQDGLQGTRGEVFYSLLKHYKNVIYFHGHSHAKFKVQELNPMNTIDNVFGRYSVHIPSLTCPTYPNAAMNDYVEDSNAGEGYIVDVYEHGIALRGMDFENFVFSPIGSYYLDTLTQKVEANTYIDPFGIVQTPIYSAHSEAGETDG